MRLHILGICGTFMGGLALLARELGWQVSGADQGIYPPMSDQLRAAGIELSEGYAALPPAADNSVVVVGNVMTRGMPAVEQLLEQKRPLVSGPEWLYRHVLGQRTVLAVAGTHGKTTTSSMLAWILEHAGLEPGFLIGGVPLNFGVSARLGGGRVFVVEADEYDSAFFDKRSKFIHYRPEVLVLNNLEFDHADIFEDLAAVRRQFHHLVRILPASARILRHSPDPALDELLQMGCWSALESFGPGGDWSYRLLEEAGGRFEVQRGGTRVGQVEWPLIGEFNCANALAAIAAASQLEVAPASACAALEHFRSPRRRLELRGDINGVCIYDDFAHHPTAIAASIQALARAAPAKRLIAVLDPASNTMRMGVHRETLAPALAGAERVYLYQPPRLEFDLEQVASACEAPASIFTDVDTLVQALAADARPGDQVLVMSNGAFGGIQAKLLDTLTPGMHADET